MDSIRFEPNQGQTDPQFRFVSRTRGSLLLIADSRIELLHSTPTRDARFVLVFDAANPQARWESLDPLPGVTSYTLGNQPERWIHDVPHFGRLIRRNLYDGIDLVLYAAGPDLEYDLVLHADADPRRIRLRFSGERRLTLRPDGALVAETESGDFFQRPPKLYQINADGSRSSATGRWRIAGPHSAAFDVRGRRKHSTVIVDPVLIAGSYIGAEGDDRVVAADPRTAIVGTTTSVGFPGFLTAKHRGTDIFVYNPQSQSTNIIGGSGDDVATCAVLGYTSLIGGYTNSTDFPVTQTNTAVGFAPSPIQSQFGGGPWDGFIVEAQSGGAIAFASYLGGSGDDRVLGIAPQGYYGFAAVGSTTSTDFPLTSAWQSTAAGGSDGFLAVMNEQGTLALSTYLGGSSDDRTVAVAFSSTGADLYVAGVTASGDWNTPGTWSGARNGSTDAFVLHATANAGWTQIQPAQGMYFGGSADDRINAIVAMPSGNVAVAGATSSADLSFPNAPQSAYAGGDTDAFVAQFSPDLQTLIQGTYLGGSGADEALALVVTPYNELLIGGWTNSSDFPVTANPISACGNGPADGFVTHLDPAAVIYSTCFGGSGTDRIVSVASDGAQNDYIAGYSDSADLPLLNPTQPGNAGGNDGFYATLSVPVIHAQGATVGKDLAAPLLASLGDPANYIGVPLTATSSDPTQVLISIHPDDPGQASATLAAAADPLFQTRRFLAACLTDSGGATVTLTAPNYPARSVNVHCVPSGLFLSNATASNNAAIVTVVPVALEPATGQPLARQNPRGGIPPIEVDAVNPAPDILSLGQSSVTIDQFSTLTSPEQYPFLGFTYTFAAPGSADLAFTTAAPFNFVPASTMHIAARGASLSLYIPYMMRDLIAQVVASYGLNLFQSGVPITFTTSDPSKALLSSGGAWQDSATATTDSSGQARVSLELLDSTGTVSITATVPGSDPVTRVVPYGKLQAGFFQYSNFQSSFYLTPGQTAQTTLQLYMSPWFAGSAPNAAAYTLRPGAAPIVVQAVSSTRNVISPESSGPFTLGYPGGSLNATASLALQAVTAGDTNLTANIVSGMAVTGPAVKVTVVPKGVTLAAGPTGYNLQSGITETIAGKADTAPVNVTFTVSDPNLALLSVDGKTPGQGTLTFSQPFANTTVYLQALAGSGSVDVTCAIDGYGSAKTTVPLVPSGFAWNLQTYTVSGSGFNPAVAAFALDPSSHAALAQQSVRPGATGAVALQVSDPAVATVSPTSLTLASLAASDANLTFTPAGGGTAQVAITQPAGSVQPAGARPLQLIAQSPTLSVQAGVISVNAQASLTVSPGRWSSSTLPAITLTSSDPSKLLLSTNSFDLGAPSVTLPALTNYSLGGQFSVYMNAIDGPADAQVTATAAGFPPTSTTVPIGLTALGLFPAYPGSGSAVTVNVQQGPTSANLNILALNNSGAVKGNVTLRPGLNSMPVGINNSNPSVATVSNQPILNSLTSSSSFSVTGIAPGQTDLSPALPAGFLAAPTSYGRSLHVTVNGPSFAIAGFTLGQDLATALRVNLQNGAATLPTDVDVTFTSSDPSSLLLSVDAATPGAPSVTLHLTRGSTPYPTIYAQAIAGSGRPTITISAPGYATTTTNVALSPTTLVARAPSQVTLQDSNSTFALFPVPAAQQQTSGTFFFRPGVSPTVSVAASPLGIVSLSPASTTWKSGATELDLKIQPLAAGSVTITTTVPAPYTAPPPVSIAVSGGYLNIGLSQITLGANLQGSIPIFVAATVTVTSSDPSRVLVAASATAAGQASTTVVASSNNNSLVYVQALASTGSATLTFSAPGYQNSTATVQLTQPVVILAPPSIGTLTPLSAPLTFQATLTTLDQFGYSGTFGAQALRPGAPPVVVQPSLSDPTVASISPAQITFNPGDSVKAFNVQPTARGTALLTLSVPPGFADPVSNRQQLLTVIPPIVSFGSTLAVGQNLVRPTSISLASAVGRAISLQLTSSDPARLLLSNASAGTPAATLNLTIPSGSSTTGPFNLIGGDSAGAATLTLSGDGLSTATYPVTVQPAGFIFTSAPAAVSINTSFTIYVENDALDSTLSPLGGFALRPGVAPVPIAVTSSNPSVIAPPASFYINGGPQATTAVVVRALAAGTATLTLQTPPGYSTPGRGTSVTIVVH